jgi:hypothetical protein
MSDDGWKFALVTLLVVAVGVLLPLAVNARGDAGASSVARIKSLHPHASHSTSPVDSQLQDYPIREVQCIRSAGGRSPR